MKNIKKIVVFDFDGTLINTMEPNQGKKIWKEKTGTNYPHKGWWGRKEALDLEIFDNNIYSDMLKEYIKFRNMPNTFIALCTGRLIYLKNQVNAILEKHNIIFDEIVLNGDKRYTIKGDKNDTLIFKLRFFNDLLNKFENATEMILFDDREKHKKTFEEWSKKQKIRIIYNFIKR